MDFYSLPKDIQEEILKLAREYPLTVEEVKECYLMGSDHANILCQLVAAKVPYSYIELQNHALWKKKNKKFMEELKNKSV